MRVIQVGRVSIAFAILAVGLGSVFSLSWIASEQFLQFDRMARVVNLHQEAIDRFNEIPEFVHQNHELNRSFEDLRRETSVLLAGLRSTVIVSFGLTIGLVVFFGFIMDKSMQSLERKLRAIVERSFLEDDEDKTPFIEVDRLYRLASLLKTRAEEHEGILRVLDEMPVNIMIADRNQNWRISYLNRTSRRTLKAVESELAVPIDQILGSSIDVFHKNPNHQRHLLSEERNLPHRAKIKLGTDTLDLRVSAIHDAQGKYAAALLTWSLVTANVKLADDFENDVSTVVQSVTTAAVNLKESANILSSAAVETGSQAIAVAKSSDVVNKNVSTVASATDELTSSIGEISQRIHEASNSIRQVVNQAQLASQVMIELSKAADDIKGVASIIDSITAQINLLALNATIESARAGEAGKGFAIVASEIKSLANETNKATAEISKRIDTVVKQTQNASLALAGIDTDIGRVDSVALAIAGAVEEQRAATAEIARNVSDVTNQVRTMADNVEGMAQVAEDTGRLATAVLGQASDLGDEGDRLKNAVEAFLIKVRAI